jgi:hypothetical protein
MKIKGGTEPNKMGSAGFLNQIAGQQQQRSKMLLNHPNSSSFPENTNNENSLGDQYITFLENQVKVGFFIFYIK